jgi:hypothetical protein
MFEFVKIRQESIESNVENNSTQPNRNKTKVEETETKKENESQIIRQDQSAKSEQKNSFNER